MKEGTLFQFVGFETSVNLDNFTEQWENFARKFFRQDIHTIILQQQVKTRNRFKYVSMNEWPQDYFCFSFMEGRGSDYFPDHRVKVVQAGGYAPVQVELTTPSAQDVKVMVFLHEEENSKPTYHKWPYNHLNVYQAYYQSCLYSSILEFYTGEEQAPELYTLLKKRFHLSDIGIYRECLVLQG